MNKKQQLREVIIKANPSLMDKGFNLEAMSKNGSPHTIETIGDIQLSHVLLAMGRYGNEKDIVRAWDLENDNLDNQSQEFYDFLWDILIGG